MKKTNAIIILLFTVVSLTLILNACVKDEDVYVALNGEAYTDSTPSTTEVNTAPTGYPTLSNDGCVCVFDQCLKNKTEPENATEEWTTESYSSTLGLTLNPTTSSKWDLVMTTYKNGDTAETSFMLGFDNVGAGSYGFSGKQTYDQATFRSDLVMLVRTSALVFSSLNDTDGLFRLYIDKKAVVGDVFWGEFAGSVYPGGDGQSYRKIKNGKFVCKISAANTASTEWNMLSTNINDALTFWSSWYTRITTSS